MTDLQIVADHRLVWKPVRPSRVKYGFRVRVLDDAGQEIIGKVTDTPYMLTLLGDRWLIVVTDSQGTSHLIFTRSKIDVMRPEPI